MVGIGLVAFLPDGTACATPVELDWNEFVVVSANVSFVLALGGW